MVQYPAYKVAAAHAAPVFLDAARTLDKACALIDEAAHHGARLVAFPEAFVPAFPIWAALEAPIRTHALFKALAADAIEIDGLELRRVRELANRRGIFVSIGFTEGTKASVECLWNSNVLIGSDGAILNHHRKLVPTYFEKLIWANGDGAGLRISETELGRVGMLICGENTNPLARYALMAQGEQVHISTYPPVWPTRPPNDGGNYDLEQAIRIPARAHAFEAKVFNIVASACVDETLRRAIESALGPSPLEILEWTSRGVSIVLGPTGSLVGDALSADEGIVYAEIDLADSVEPKQFPDVVGYYNRFDVFRLEVNRTANRPIHFPAEAPPDLPPAGGETDPDKQAALLTTGA